MNTSVEKIARIMLRMIADNSKPGGVDAAQICSMMSPLHPPTIIDAMTFLISGDHVRYELRNRMYYRARPGADLLGELRHADGDTPDTPTDEQLRHADNNAQTSEDCAASRARHVRELENNLTTVVKDQLRKATAKKAPSLRSGVKKVSQTPTSSPTTFGSFIAADFRPDADLLKWAAKEIPEVDVVAETPIFVDHWMSASGQRARKRDWRRAWQVWMRRAQREELRRHGTRRSSTPKPVFYEPEPPDGMDLYSAEYQNWRREYIEDWTRRNGAAR
jgi:hypothetical protein